MIHVIYVKVRITNIVFMVTYTHIYLLLKTLILFIQMSNASPKECWMQTNGNTLVTNSHLHTSQTNTVTDYVIYNKKVKHSVYASYQWRYSSMKTVCHELAWQLDSFLNLPKTQRTIMGKVHVWNECKTIVCYPGKVCAQTTRKDRRQTI